MKTAMITPNQLEQATKELSKVDLGKYSIPTEIQELEKDYYVVIGLNATKVGLTTRVEARTVYYDEKQWGRMAKDLASKRPMFKVMGANQFEQVVILHNPTMPLAKEGSEPTETDGTIQGELFETTGRLSDTKKATVNKLMEEGKGEDDNGINEIAKAVNASFVKVKEYIKSF